MQDSQKGWDLQGAAGGETDAQWTIHDLQFSSCSEGLKPLSRIRKGWLRGL